MDSFTTQVSLGMGRTSWPLSRIAATMEAATSSAPSDFAAGRLRPHAEFGFGVPRAISFAE